MNILGAAGTTRVSCTYLTSDNKPLGCYNNVLLLNPCSAWEVR